MRRPSDVWRAAWMTLRAVTGDDAYERYLVHHRQGHAAEPLLDRRAFYRAELDRRFTRPNRCC